MEANEANGLNLRRKLIKLIFAFAIDLLYILAGQGGLAYLAGLACLAGLAWPGWPGLAWLAWLVC